MKDRNIEALKDDFDKIKSEYLEHKVSELACCMGYSEKGERVWKFRNPLLYKFIKDKKTNSVEIDVHQYQTEHVSGKERRVFLAAECKYRERTARVRDLKFFQQKIVDLYEQMKEQDERFPRKAVPRVGNLWFVSVKGFSKKALARSFKVSGCSMEPIDRVKLNRLLKENNIREIAIS